MWVLPKKLQLKVDPKYQPLSVSAQGMADWKKVSKEFSEKYGFSLFLKSKPIQSQILSQRWKQANWKMHLCGRILKPSLVRCFETKLISSLVVFHANPFPQSDGEKVTKTRDTYSPTSSDQSDPSDRGKSSLRTSKGSCPQQLSLADGMTLLGHRFCSMSVESWKEKVIEWKQEYSVRRKSGHPIKEKGSSFSRNWITPNARDWKGAPTMKGLIRSCGKLRLDQLDRQVEHHPLIATGLPSSEKIRSLMNLPEHSTLTRRVSPDWVETLMGLPMNWTQLSEEWRTEPIDSSSAVMELSLKLPKEPIGCSLRQRGGWSGASTQRGANE